MISRKGNSLSVIFSMAWRPSLWGAKDVARAIKVFGINPDVPNPATV